MYTAAQTEAFRASFTLDSFLPGHNNRFALHAARAVASQPGGKFYNPLMLYGPSGVGKTHLLHAIANETRRRNPQARIRYIRSEDFTRELVESIQGGYCMKFRKEYMDLDLLLVDDIQFLAGKEATQEEFFHLFNHMYERDCQIVLASDCPPKDMKTLADRLTSRFTWGLMADLTIPDLEVREELLRRGARERQLELQPEQVTYIAEHVPRGGFELAGVLNNLLALSLQPDMDMVCRAVAQLLPSPAGCSDSAPVIRNVCELFQISREDLLGHGRGKSAARMATAYLLAELCQMPLSQIAALMDRDPATVLYLLRCAEARMDKFPDFQEQIRSLADLVTAESE